MKKYIVKFTQSERDDLNTDLHITPCSPVAISVAELPSGAATVG